MCDRSDFVSDNTSKIEIPGDPGDFVRGIEIPGIPGNVHVFCVVSCDLRRELLEWFYTQPVRVSL